MGVGEAGSQGGFCRLVSTWAGLSKAGTQLQFSCGRSCPPRGAGDPSILGDFRETADGESGLRISAPNPLHV